nr:hypothetical protein [Methanobacterium formicicum]
METLEGRTLQLAGEFRVRSIFFKPKKKFQSGDPVMKVLFVEPPKVLWFVMGEYMPPPLGILQLAAYLESKK